MTLNAVIALILRFFSRNLTDFQANYITVVEVVIIFSDVKPQQMSHQYIRFRLLTSELNES